MVAINGFCEFILYFRGVKFGAGVFLLALVACGGNVKTQPNVEQTALLSQHAVNTQAESAPQLREPVVEKAHRSVRVERLERQAEAALLEGKLTLPENDNAFDRFTAILMLDKQNEYAKNGLNRVLLAYVARIHQALAKGQIVRAKSMLESAKVNFPNNPLVEGLSEKVAMAVKTQKQAIKPVSIESDRRILLSPVGLKQKSPEVESVLAKVADRVSQTDESVLIYARTDAEGRWIYQAMKKASTGYRIRGDIRIHSEPAIIFMTNLEDNEDNEDVQ